MKNFVFLIVVFLLISCQPKDLPTQLNIEEGYALMKISHMTTKDELKAMAQKLSERDIQMDFDGSTFFEDGKLQNLILTIVTPDGNKGRTTADIVALQFRYFGFLYQKDRSPSFKIGEI